MLRSVLFLLAASLPLAACDKPAARIVSQPQQPDVSHSEPVYYNGKHYMVDFAFSRPQNAYQVKVSGKGRSLGGEEGDRKIIEQIAISAVRHFACPDRAKGQVVPGTTRHTGSAWQLQARCV
ncbi:MAG: hypothetical protein AB7S41_02275 [Parvibaculaceae bacterium]